MVSKGFESGQNETERKWKRIEWKWDRRQQSRTSKNGQATASKEREDKGERKLQQQRRWQQLWWNCLLNIKKDQKKSSWSLKRWGLEKTELMKNACWGSYGHPNLTPVLPFLQCITVDKSTTQTFKMTLTVVVIINFRSVAFPIQSWLDVHVNNKSYRRQCWSTHWSTVQNHLWNFRCFFSNIKLIRCTCK